MFFMLIRISKVSSIQNLCEKKLRRAAHAEQDEEDFSIQSPLERHKVAYRQRQSWQHRLADFI